MQIDVTLPSRVVIKVSEVLFFNNAPVAIKSFKAVTLVQGQAIEVNYLALTPDELRVIETNIWNEYYRIQDEAIAKYGRGGQLGYNMEFDELLTG